MTLNATVGIIQKPLNWGCSFSIVVAAPSPVPGCPLQYFVMAECWASQKKSFKYNQKLLLTGTVEEYGVKVEHAHCTCPAEIAGGCQYVVACFFAMEKYKQTNTTTSLPPPESCASLQRATSAQHKSSSAAAGGRREGIISTSDVDSAECATTKRMHASANYNPDFLAGTLSFIPRGARRSSTSNPLSAMSDLPRVADSSSLRNPLCSNNSQSLMLLVNSSDKNAIPPDGTIPIKPLKVVWLLHVPLSWDCTGRDDSTSRCNSKQSIMRKVSGSMS